MDYDLALAYGRGWGVPSRFSCHAGIQMSSDEMDIRQSLSILMSTQSGEQMVRDVFSCDTRLFVFESIQPELLELISSRIREHILLGEPRVKPESIIAEQDRTVPSRVNILVNYIIRDSAIPGQIDGYLDILEGFRGFFR